MASLAMQRVGVGLLERLDSPLTLNAPLSKRTDQHSSESPLEPMNSTTPSTTSEPEPEVEELILGPPTVSSVHSHSASFSWGPLGKLLTGLKAVYVLELQQLEAADSFRNISWLSVYKGSELYCKVDDLKSGRRYAVRLVASVENSVLGEDSTDIVFRVRTAEPTFFQTPPTVPSQMQPPSLTQRARNALKLKWNVPEDPGGVFEVTYVLQVSPAPLGLEEHRSDEGFVEVYRGPERSFKVTKLQPGVRYSCHVQAINPIGEGPFSLKSAFTTQATVPAPPDPPLLVAASATSLTLQWSAPPDNGSPIIVYCLEYDDGGGTFLPAYNGPNLTHTVKSLRPGSRYRFRLRADNDEGKSLWSAYVDMATGPAPPDSPLSLQVVAAQRTSATLAWRAPDNDGGSRVSGFEVELQAKSRAAIACMGSDWLRIFDGEAHACTINSLRPGCAYRVRVRARNLAGWGQWALPVDLTTAADVPEVPVALQPGGCGRTSMVITWSPPRHDGGAKVQMYRLELWNADCSCGRCPQALAPAPLPPPPAQAPSPMLPHGPNAAQYAGPPPPPPPLTSSGSQTQLLQFAPCPSYRKPLTLYQGETAGSELRNLSPGTRYMFRVQAVNPIGPSPWTDWVVSATAPDVPVTPAPPAVTGVAAGALVLSWQAAQAQGAPVTHYTVEVATLPHVPMMNHPGPAGFVDPRITGNLRFKVAYHGHHLNCEVRDLEPYCAYALRLCAHSDVGPSPWSVCAAAITSHAPPTCPQTVSAQAASSSKILLCWAPPERDYGAAVLSYTVDMAPLSRNVANRQGPGGAASWSHVYTGPACACSAEGLNAGRTYQFRIRAANICGCGPFAAPVTTTTLPAPPSAPGKPVTSARMATGFRVRWDEPEQTHGAHVTAYVLEVSVVGTDEWAVSYTGLEAAAKVTGLQPATKYLVRAAAVNSAGQGPFGECEAVTTMLLPPLPPSDLAVMEQPELAPPASPAAVAEGATFAASQGDAMAAATVAWQEPAAEGSHAPVLSYEVTATPKPGSDVSGAPGGGVVKLTVTGRRCEARLEVLLPGCSYGVRVRAVGVDGTGHSGWSEEVGLTTPARPEAETAAAASSGNTGPSSAPSAAQQRKGSAANRKAKRAAAALAAAAPLAVAGGASSGAASAASGGPAGSNASAEDGVLPSAPPSRGRAKGSGAASRVSAALNLVAAKPVPRKATFLERLVDDSRLGSGLEVLARALFGPNWRRDHMRLLKTFGKWVGIIAVFVLIIFFVVSWRREGAGAAAR